MTLDRARWDTGMTYDAFKATMTRNQDRFSENEARVALDPETVRTFKSLPKGLRVLVLAEDWCGDVVANLPILGRLAKEVPTLDVRIFYRDQNPDLIALRTAEGVSEGALGVAETYPFNPWVQIQVTPYQKSADPLINDKPVNHYVLLMQQLQLAHQAAG